MAIQATNDGLDLFAKAALTQGTQPSSVKYRLYTNNVTPVAASTYSDFTAAVHTTEGAQTVNYGDWSVTTATGTSNVTAPGLVWHVTAAETYYGYYVSDSSDSHCLWAELFSEGPFTYPSTGGELDLTPKIQFVSPI